MREREPARLAQWWNHATLPSDGWRVARVGSATAAAEDGTPHDGVCCWLSPPTDVHQPCRLHNVPSRDEDRCATGFGDAGSARIRPASEQRCGGVRLRCATLWVPRRYPDSPDQQPTNIRSVRQNDNSRKAISALISSLLPYSPPTPASRRSPPSARQTSAAEAATNDGPVSNGAHGPWLSSPFLPPATC